MLVFCFSQKHVSCFSKISTDFRTHGFYVDFQIRIRLRSGLRSRTSDLATRRDQPRHTGTGVQDRGRRRTATRARPGAVPGAGDQDRGVPGRETRAVPGRQTVPGDRREESAGAGRQTVPGAGVQDQAHLPRAQMVQVAQRLVVRTTPPCRNRGGKTK